MKILRRQPLIDAFAIAMGGIVANASPPKSAEIVTLPRSRQLTTEILDKATSLTREDIGGERVFDEGDWSPWETDLAKGGWQSQSDADLALCGAAARALEKLGITDEDELETGVRAIMERSALSQRAKWARDDYSTSTIRKVVAPILARQQAQFAASNDDGTDEVLVEVDDSDSSQSKANKASRDIRRGDILAGEILVDQHLNSLRYCEERKCWYVWTGNHWIRADRGDVVERAKATAGGLLDWATATMKMDAEKGARALKFAMRYHSKQGQDAMLAMAESDPRIRVKVADLDADPDLLGVANGYVHLPTGQCYPPDPAKLITRIANGEYDPKAECPQWMQFLAEIFEGDQEKIDFIQRVAGYTATGHNSEEVFFFHVGYGRNGKSVYANTKNRILGDYVVTAPSSLMTYRPNDTGARNDIAALAGARTVSLNELQAGDRADEQTIKLLAGREKISARFLYGEYFEFWPTATPELRSNHAPIITGTDDGIWRRIVLIRYPRKFTEEEADPHLEQRLMQERNGILRWIIEGANAWYAHGLQIPTSIRRESNAYRQASDLLGQFLDEVTRTGADRRVEQSILWSSWLSHCHNEGNHSGTKTSFTRRLSERGFSTVRSNGKKYYGGLEMGKSTG